jgi:hypothetical protein
MEDQPPLAVQRVEARLWLVAALLQHRVERPDVGLARDGVEVAELAVRDAGPMHNDRRPAEQAQRCAGALGLLDQRDALGDERVAQAGAS